MVNIALSPTTGNKRLVIEQYDKNYISPTIGNKRLIMEPKLKSDVIN